MLCQHLRPAGSPWVKLTSILHDDHPAIPQILPLDDLLHSLELLDKCIIENLLHVEEDCVFFRPVREALCKRHIAVDICLALQRDEFHPFDCFYSASKSRATDNCDCVVQFEQLVRQDDCGSDMAKCRQGKENNVNV